MTRSFAIFARALAVLALACALAACGDDDAPNEAAQTSINNSTNNAATSANNAATSTNAGTTGSNNAQGVTLDNAPELEGVQAASCGADPSAASVSGLVYVDQNSNATSAYDQKLDPQDTALAGAKVTLVGAGGVARTTSCDDGAFAFDAVADGRYVLDVQSPNGDLTCASANCAARFPRAVAEGSVKVVAFGDSVPAFGPEPWFPSRFGELVSTMADVEVRNVAVPGARSRDWLPSRRYFTDRLAPELADADVVVFSLGGNDLYSLVDNLSSPDAGGILEQVDEFNAIIEQTKANLKTIIAAIRERNADADIVWLLYPNYAQSSAWGDIAGEYHETAILLLETQLKAIRAEMTADTGLLLVDLLVAVTPEAIDGYLIDELHLGTEGHAFYAEELFFALGGVTVGGANPRSQDRLFALETPP